MYTAEISAPRKEVSARLSIWLQNFATSILPGSRDTIAKQALANNATHSSGSTPTWSFRRICCAALATRLDIVGANCLGAASALHDTARYDRATTSQPLSSSTGLREVARLGFGVVLVSADVFRAMPMPWFAFQWMPETAFEVFRGEDFYFFNRARKAG